MRRSGGGGGGFEGEMKRGYGEIGMMGGWGNGLGFGEYRGGGRYGRGNFWCGGEERGVWEVEGIEDEGWLRGGYDVEGMMGLEGFWWGFLGGEVFGGFGLGYMCLGGVGGGYCVKGVGKLWVRGIFVCGVVLGIEGRVYSMGGWGGVKGGGNEEDESEMKGSVWGDDEFMEVVRGLEDLDDVVDRGGGGGD
uniref:Uncharacterized protein n=1 Tax=Knipowitschia caucasica TaxID=637954 RepID=A0AAV2M7H7_KNICA